MSQEKRYESGRHPEPELELVRRAWESIQTKQLEQLDDLVDGAYEWDCAAEHPGVQVHRGREAVKAHIATWPEGWDEYSLWSEELIECEHGILQLVHLRAFRQDRGGARREDRGAEIDQPAAFFHTLAEGRLLKTDVYWHRRDALAVAGLSD